MYAAERMGWAEIVGQNMQRGLQAGGKVSERLHDREQHDSVKVCALNVIRMVAMVAMVVDGVYG